MAAHRLNDGGPVQLARHATCPVTMGGNIIYPGDIVVLDADGAITVRPSRLDEILEKAEARATKEAALRERYKNGERSYDMRGWRELVEAPR